MLTVTFSIHGDLQDFLRPERRNAALVCLLREPAAVKHPIESLGIPHPEVEALYVNDNPIDFGYTVGDGDWVRVYPAGALPAAADAVPLRPPLKPPYRFVLDTHLGLLASYLRLLGFDALYRNDFDDQELAELGATDERILLTRDRGLLKRKIVTYGYCVRESNPRQQLTSILRRYNLARFIQPWQRCLRCNGALEHVDKATVLAQLEPKTRRYYNEFQRCTGCGRIFWQGSHFAHLEKFLGEVMAEL